jgi:hypothetical protein
MAVKRHTPSLVLMRIVKCLTKSCYAQRHARLLTFPIAAIGERPILGQQATFTDASRIFALTVRNRECNPAAFGQNPPLTRSKWLPGTGR